MKKNFLFFISVILLIIVAGAVHSQTTATSTAIKMYINDNANVFSERAKFTLEENLRELEKNTNGVQFVIFTEKNIPDGTTLEERSLQIAEQNGVGKKGADNGILFYLATEDRQFRWEVGYGMESTLNAALLGRISREKMVPEFKNGNFEGGILIGADTVEKIVLSSGDPDVMKQLGLGEAQFSWADFLLKNWVFWLILFLFISSIIKAIARASQMQKGKKAKPDSFYHGALAAILLGRGPGGGMGGGGFGGGGFGGFSGGGGSFGGGGFSGKF